MVVHNKSWKRWTPAVEDLVSQAHSLGGLRSAAIVGAQHGFSRSAVKNRLHKLGVRHPANYWTAAEDDQLIELFKTGISAEEIARLIGRGIAGVKRRAYILGLLRGPRFSDKQLEIIRTNYRLVGAKQLAIDLLGSGSKENTLYIYRQAARLHVTQPSRHPQHIKDLVRQLNAMGKSDGEIARTVEYFAGRREAVTAIRRRLGIPAVIPTIEQRSERGRRVRNKQIADGMRDLRAIAHRQFAISYGLPASMPFRAVQILIALAGGPLSIAGLESKDCFPSRLWNGKNTTYIGGLVNEGYVTFIRNRDNSRLYFLSPSTIETLSRAGQAKEVHR